MPEHQELVLIVDELLRGRTRILPWIVGIFLLPRLLVWGVQSLVPNHTPFLPELVLSIAMSFFPAFQLWCYQNEAEVRHTLVLVFITQVVLFGYCTFFLPGEYAVLILRLPVNLGLADSVRSISFWMWDSG